MRPAHACAALLLVLPGAAPASAQTSDGAETQVWGNLTAGRRHGERWYSQLDVEPKWQVSGEPWRAFQLTPTGEHYPSDWLDLLAELAVSNTLQRDGLGPRGRARPALRLHEQQRLRVRRPERRRGTVLALPPLGQGRAHHSPRRGRYNQGTVGSNAEHYVQGGGLRLGIPIKGGLGLGADAYLFDRRSHYVLTDGSDGEESRQSIEQRNPQVRVYLSFNDVR